MKTNIYLPKIIVDPHCHGRDLNQKHKTTIKQTMREAAKSLVSISVFMPNFPPIATIETLKQIIQKIREAKESLKISHPQYLYFGITDDNLEECEIALQYKEVVGLKDYPLSKKGGKTVTTGTIGVSKESTRLTGMQLCAKLD